MAHHLDFQYCPGKLWRKRYEAETILGNVVSIASCLMGVFAGLLLRSRNWSERQKLAWLLGAGAGAVLVGFLWSFQLPLIKLLSTPSFVLMAGGYGAILMGVFYWMVDMRGWRRWCQPFIWIGMNPITIYLLTGLVDFGSLAARLVGGPIGKWLDSMVAIGAGALAIQIVALGLALLVVYFLYRKQIFLRV